MRLIDADRVIQSVDMQIIMAREMLRNDPQYQEFVSITEQCFKQEISNAPTVKAIPIEWIMKKLIEADNTGMDIEDWSIKDCYALVLDEWEKENEQSNN